MNKLRNFLAWPRSRKRLLFRTLLLVAGVRAALLLLPSRSVSAALTDPAPAGDADSTDWGRIREIASMISYASRFVPGATCLTQALAARKMLSRVGQSCSLKIGVEKDARRGFRAHAWIEVDGKIAIGKVGNIRQYSVLEHRGEQLA